VRCRRARPALLICRRRIKCRTGTSRTRTLRSAGPQQPHDAAHRHQLRPIGRTTACKAMDGLTCKHHMLCRRRRRRHPAAASGMGSGARHRPALRVAPCLAALWALVLLAPAATAAVAEEFVCGNTEPSVPVVKQVQSEVANHRANNRVAFTTVTIPVYYHVIAQVRRPAHRCSLLPPHHAATAPRQSCVRV